LDSSLVAGAFQPIPAAHDAYLQAHYELARRGDGDLGKAVSQLRQAVRIDSQYAVAWAELAQALTVLPLYADGDPAVLQPEALRAAQRAIGLDSTLAAAHAALGNLLNAQWRYPEGLASLRKAVALDSNYASAHQWLGENLLLNGDFAGADQALGAAVRLDSTLSVTRAVHGVALALMNRTAESDRLMAAALARTPSVSALHVIRATALIYSNRMSEAVSALEVARILDPGSPLVLGTLGYAYGRSGNRAKADEMTQLLSRDTTRAGSLGALGKVRLGVGDTTAALDWFERALRDRDPLFASEPLRSPIYVPLHRNGRCARPWRRAGSPRRRTPAWPRWRRTPSSMLQGS
jgi:tetratricopeptide (TPR) repeat protein